ncbi:hypothetical protein ACP70R_042122 [Stipagrostis hirtigluma subsp. patula]
MAARPVLDPQLVMAARRGDGNRLRQLLGRSDVEESAAEAAAQVIVDYESAASSSAAEAEIVVDHQAEASS